MAESPGVSEAAQRGQFMRMERNEDREARDVYAANFRREITELVKEEPLGNVWLPSPDRASVMFKLIPFVDRSRGSFSQSHASVWVGEMQKLGEILEKTWDMASLSPQLKQLLVVPEEWDDVVRHSQKFSDFTGKLRNTKLFRTDKHLLGLGGPQVCSGGEVYILNGSYAPVLLQR